MKMNYYNHNVWKYAKEIGYTSKNAIPWVITGRACRESEKIPLETKITKKHNQAEVPVGI